MATLPQLIDVFTRHDGRGHAALTQYGRVIRDAGFIPRGKRGHGAPRMTPENAVTLLLGIYGAASPKDAPRAVAQLRTLRPQRRGIEGTLPDWTQAVSGAETFDDALAELLVRVPDVVETIRSFIAAAHSDQGDDALAALTRAALGGWGTLTLSVTLSANTAWMGLTSPPPFKNQVHWEERFVVDAKLFGEGFYGPPGRFDRRVEITFGLPTLMDLHALVVADGEVEPAP